MNKIKIFTAACAAAAALGLAGCGSASAPTPASILRADGYTTVASLSQDAIDGLVGGTDSTGVAMARDMLADGSMGTGKHGNETVIRLTTRGQDVIGNMLPYTKPGDFGYGVTAHLADGGKFLVLDNPSGTWTCPGGINAQGSCNLNFH